MEDVSNAKITDAVARKCSVKKVFLEILQNSQENTFFKKETLSQVFSCKFCEISKNTYSYITPQETASEINLLREQS